MNQEINPAKSFFSSEIKEDITNQQLLQYYISTMKQCNELWNSEDDHKGNCGKVFIYITFNEDNQLFSLHSGIDGSTAKDSPKLSIYNSPIKHTKASLIRLLRQLNRKIDHHKLLTRFCELENQRTSEPTTEVNSATITNAQLNLLKEYLDIYGKVLNIDLYDVTTRAYIGTISDRHYTNYALRLTNSIVNDESTSNNPLSIVLSNTNILPTNNRSLTVFFHPKFLNWSAYV
jgi:hypothetical protein